MEEILQKGKRTFSRLPLKDLFKDLTLLIIGNLIVPLFCIALLPWIGRGKWNSP